MLDDFNRMFADYWRILLNTFWFVPGLVSLAGPLLALFFLNLDHYFYPGRVMFIFSGGATEANTILSTIAGSLITVAGLAFSITIVVLQLVASEYTPRALRGFPARSCHSSCCRRLLRHFRVFLDRARYRTRVFPHRLWLSARLQYHHCYWSRFSRTRALTDLCASYRAGYPGLGYRGTSYRADNSSHSSAALPGMGE